jgi:micrococcal nuclease
VKGRGSIAVLLIAAAILLRPWDRGSADGPGGSEHLTGRVVRAVDGDTLEVAIDGGPTETVRLIGVDTPETVKPDTPVQCFGPRASAFSKHVLGAAGRVRYRVALEPVDVYGRRLVYLWLPDGRFYNAMLIRRGLARPLPFPPNTRYAPLFARLAERAARRGRGLWGRC